jgi:hypothetical protein
MKGTDSTRENDIPPYGGQFASSLESSQENFGEFKGILLGEQRGFDPLLLDLS